jgi:hypothetical protein
MKHDLGRVFTAIIMFSLSTATAQQAEDQQVQTGGHAWVRS